MAAPDALASLAWGECLVPATSPPAELAQRIRREQGMLPDWLPRLAPLPWLSLTFSGIGATPFAYLPVRLIEFVALVVSRDNSCRFCWGAQRAFMGMLGYDAGEIDRIERDDLVSLDPAERAALEFARRISRGTPRVTAAERATLERLGFSRPQVAELAFAAAITIFANRVSTLLALPPARLERPAYRIAARLLRPVIVRRLAPRLRTPEPAPGQNAGIGAAVVTALGDSPAAGALRRTVDDALASPVLPLRAKLLMLGVVARALDCRHSEREITAALVADGMAPGDVANALAHLAGIGLEEDHARLLPFARDTVRCQPQEIQPRTRELAGALGVDALLEVVGVAALANALCRASVLLDPC